MGCNGCPQGNTLNIDIHIGTHKTGSTSFQCALAQNRDQLLKNKIIFYQGTILKDNHIELTEVCIRSHVEKMVDFRPEAKKLSNLSYSTVRENILSLLSDGKNNGIKKFIFSCESLSLFREVEEVKRLRDLFPGYCNIRIFVVLRDKSSFLSKYAAQVVRFSGRHESQDPESALYVGHDSWLIDFERLLEVYKTVFETVKELKYNVVDTTKILGDAMGIADMISVVPGHRVNSSSTLLRKIGGIPNKLNEILNNLVRLLKRFRH